MKKLGLPERFWRKVLVGKPDECWPWLGSVKETGYGLFGYKGKVERVHRLILGEIPKGMQALHKCDFPACCNPRHLYAGTIKQNSEDRVKRGRVYVRRGSVNLNSKLTENDVLAIRAEFPSLPKRGNFVTDEGKVALASKYGITVANMMFIVKRKTWTHI